jgi:hypothetical protein
MGMLADDLIRCWAVLLIQVELLAMLYLSEEMRIARVRAVLRFERW